MPSVPNAAARKRILVATENRLARSGAQRLAAVRGKLIALLNEADIYAVSAGRQERRLQAIYARAADLISNAYADLNATAREQLVTLAAQHGARVAADVEKAIAAKGYNVRLVLPTQAEFRALATMTPVRGAVMRDWWTRQRQTTLRKFKDEVRIGYLNGEGIPDLTNRVSDALDVAANQAEALARTAVNSVANRAAMDTYKENSDLVGSFQYVAVLDDRTTDICEELDGEIFALDDPEAKVPPQHWNCRSTTIPVINWGAVKAASEPADESAA